MFQSMFSRDLQFLFSYDIKQSLEDMEYYIALLKEYFK